MPQCTMADWSSMSVVTTSVTTDILCMIYRINNFYMIVLRRNMYIYVYSRCIVTSMYIYIYLCMLLPPIYQDSNLLALFARTLLLQMVSRRSPSGTTILPVINAGFRLYWCSEVSVHPLHELALLLGNIKQRVPMLVDTLIYMP